MSGRLGRRRGEPALVPIRGPVAEDQGYGLASDVASWDPSPDSDLVPLRQPSSARESQRHQSQDAEYGLAADVATPDVEEGGLDVLREVQAAYVTPEGTMLRVNPPGSPTRLTGSRYKYNETTGLLAKEGAGVAINKLATVYVENPGTGAFYRVPDDSRSQKPWVVKALKQPPPGQPQSNTGTEGSSRAPPAPPPAADSHSRRQTWEAEAAGAPQGSPLVALVGSSASALASIALFAQGLLGGFGLLNLFMIYLWDPSHWSSPLTGFLQFYSPIAMSVNRIYYTLITVSLVAACSSFAKDSLLESKRLNYLQMRRMDVVLIFVYGVAFILSVVCTPFDDELQYSYRRIPDFYSLTLNSHFQSRLSLWHWLNLGRVAASGLGWLLVCIKMSSMSLTPVGGTTPSGEQATSALPASVEMATNPLAR
ncbi:hypothetical protein WJX72_007418 [[Myrmecia] bisecta]|uniref:Uncharacterized protein n=1 Tax=[Myrmecia] bisecta TaxID=41462 RepID=A0AAW1Q712_9CHLO